jgi:hypothetical protein
MQDQFKVVKKMLAIAGQLRLTPAEVRRTHAELRRQSWSLLYEASRRGLAAYFVVVAFMLGRGVVRPVLHIKHLIRALVFSTRLRASAAPDTSGARS